MPQNRPIETKRIKGKFAPGYSGNPGGIPKATVHCRTLARQYTQDAIEALAWEMYEGETAATRIAAAIALLDRAWGKPTQPIAGDDSMDALRIADGRNAIIGRLDRLIAIAETNGFEEGDREPVAERLH